MSFILDALKKSETERQRKSTPGVADIPDARPPSRTPRWLWLVAALLAVNLGVLVVVLLKPGADAEPASVTRPLELPDTAAGPSFSELVAAAKERQRQTEPPVAVREEGPSPVARAEAVEPPAEPEPEPVDIGSLATFDELRARGDLMLPELHLDLHVYGERAADRFVVVNMSRYKEGAALAEGPQVKTILPNGVVLEHQGTEFFLPRQ